MDSIPLGAGCLVLMVECDSELYSERDAVAQALLRIRLFQVSVILGLQDDRLARCS